MRDRLLIAVVGLLSLAAAGTANATPYTSSTAFLSATTGTTIEDYSTTTAGQLVADGSTLNGLTYSFSTGAGLGGVITDMYNSFTGLSLAAKQVSGPLNSSDFFFGGNSVTITFPSPVTAVGIFANVNPNSGTYTLSAAPGTATTGSATYDTNSFVFVGFTDVTPFLSATFTSNDASLGSYNIPEIIYGTALPVPEPASLMIFATGLVGLALVRRHKPS
jgi:PEP-CTERM motif